MSLWQLCMLLPLGFAAGSELQQVSIMALGADGQPVAQGSALQAIDITFQTRTAGATEATVVLPAGLISVTGSSNLTFTAPGGTTVTYTTTTVTTTIYNDTDDNATTLPARRLDDHPGYRPGRRLSSTCVVTGASITGTTMTLSIEDPSDGSPCPAGATVQTSVTQDSGGTATFTNNVANPTISFQISTNTDTVSIPVVLSPGAGGTFSVSVVGDPITWYGGKKIKFWFPNYKLMPLLKTPEMTIWASTFEGPTQDYQWFERFALCSAYCFMSV